MQVASTANFQTTSDIFIKNSSLVLHPGASVDIGLNAKIAILSKLDIYGSVTVSDGAIFMLGTNDINQLAQLANRGTVTVENGATLNVGVQSSVTILGTLMLEYNARAITNQSSFIYINPMGSISVQGFTLQVGMNARLLVGANSKMTLLGDVTIGSGAVLNVQNGTQCNIVHTLNIPANSNLVLTPTSSGESLVCFHSSTSEPEEFTEFMERQLRDESRIIAGYESFQVSEW